MPRMAYIDLDNLRSVFLDDAALKQRRLSRQRAGMLQITSGRIVACDPLVQPERPAFARALAQRGGHAVDVILGSVPALAVLWLRERAGLDAAALHWEPALLDGESADMLAGDAFYGYPMGTTAETVAGRHGIDRARQDAFALASQQRASNAARAGRFAAEIAPVAVPSRQGEVTVDADEHIRHDASPEALARLRPAFAENGTVTAGNASGINDGAAMLVLADREEAARRGLPVLAEIAGWAHAGLDPQVMGLGPIPASRKLLERIGWRIEDVELWEINEAFAAQSLAVIDALGLDPARVNVNGGAIALGHPIGASGARILVSLVHEMSRRAARRGVAALCIGGGMGIALAVQRD